jgi:cytochrome c553
MTERRTGYCLKSSDLIGSVLVSTFALAACEALVGDGPVAPVQSDAGSAVDGKQWDGAAAQATSAPPDDGGAAAPAASALLPPPPKQQAPCGQAAQQAQSALQTYCASCHGASSDGKGGFKTVLDVAALTASGKVVPNKPDASPLLKRMAAGSMPPQDVQKRPTAADITAVSEWISCGAPSFSSAAAATYAFMNIDQRLRSVLADLRAMPNVVNRQRTRYLDLSSLANAGYSKQQLQVYREAVSFLLNSLSRGRTVVAPKAIDADQLLYRIDLRDYLWDADSWRLLERSYPYAVTYDQDSRLFPYDEVSAQQIRQETGATIPIIQGDWFISHASRPPLYHQLLELPASLAELETQLGVDIDRNIEDEEVLRAGFKNAGPSQNHRVIERHELGGNRGALWVSYDFANNLAARNVFANPLDFQEDGGELIFNLDNGLQAYFVVDANGRRLDKAPNNVVQDPLSRDGAVENGISCMGCHQEEGQLQKYDEVRDFVLSTSASAAETDAVLALYADRPALESAFAADQNRYRTARADLDIENVSASTFHSLDDIHQGVLDIELVAAVIGIPTALLERALDASPQAFPSEIVTLRTQGGGVQRDAFEAVLPDLIEALGLGRQLRAAGSQSPVNPPRTPLPVVDAGASGSTSDAGRRR